MTVKWIVIISLVLAALPSEGGFNLIGPGATYYGSDADRDNLSKALDAYRNVDPTKDPKTAEKRLTVVRQALMQMKNDGAKVFVDPTGMSDSELDNHLILHFRGIIPIRKIVQLCYLIACVATAQVDGGKADIDDGLNQLPAAIESVQTSRKRPGAQ